jgi:hypothetical protein
MPLVHITIANKPHPGLDALRLSTKRHNVQTRVLGMGSKTAIGHGGNGFGLKLELLHQELKLLPLDALVLFTDAFDVLLQDSEDGIVDWITANSSKVLFAAEKTKWPCKELMYPSPLNLPYAYLNSGVFAGTSGAILSLLDSAPYTNLTDDQEYYTRLFLGGAPIVLDHKAQYFQCLQGVDKSTLVFDTALQKVHVQHDDGVAPWSTTPTVLHLNNGGTRLKLFTPCINTVLGPAYAYLSRQIMISIILDFLSYNFSTIFNVLALILCVMLWQNVLRLQA